MRRVLLRIRARFHQRRANYWREVLPRLDAGEVTRAFQKMIASEAAAEKFFARIKAGAEKNA